MIPIWVTENWLALYVAVVATLAMLFSLFRFLHAINKSKVKLSLEISPVASDGIQTARQGDMVNRDERGLVEIYHLRIRNTGNIHAYIENATLITKSNQIKEALVGSKLSNISNQTPIQIKAKSSEKFKFYLSSDEEIFFPEKIVVTDCSGKAWKKRV